MRPSVSDATGPSARRDRKPAIPHMAGEGTDRVGGHATAARARTRPGILCSVHTGPAPSAGAAAGALRALLAERRREAEAVLSLVQRISSPLDLATVLQETVAIAAAVTRCHGALIYLLDEAGERLWIRAGVEGYEQWIDRFSLELGRGLTGWTAVNRTPAVIGENPLDDPRYLEVPELNDPRFQSVLTYPLVSPSDRLVGVLTLHTIAPHEFSEDDFTLVGPIAALAAAAVENAQLYAERERQLDVLRSLASAGDSAERARAVGPRRLGAAPRRRRGRARAAARRPRALAAGGALDRPAREPVRPEALAKPALLDALLEAGDVQALTRRRHGALLGADRRRRLAPRPWHRRTARGGRGARRPAALPRHAGARAALRARRPRRDRPPGRAGAPRRRSARAARDARRGPGAARGARGRRGAGVGAERPRAPPGLRPRRAARRGHAGGGGRRRGRRRSGARAARRSAPSSSRASRARSSPRATCGPPRSCGCATRPRSASGSAACSRSPSGAAACASRVAARAPAPSSPATRRRSTRRARRCASAARCRGPGVVVDVDALGAQRYLWALAQEPARDLDQERLERLLQHDRATARSSSRPWRPTWSTAATARRRRRACSSTATRCASGSSASAASPDVDLDDVGAALRPAARRPHRALPRRAR